MKTAAIFFALTCYGSTAVACADVDALMSSSETGSDAALSLQNRSVSEPFEGRIWLCDVQSFSDVKLEAVMPAHNHGLVYDPEITRNEDGSFMVKNLLFHMPGLWQVSFEVEHAEGRDRYVWDIYQN